MVKPVGDLLETADAVLGLAGAGELVVLAMEQADPRLDAVNLER